MNRKPGFIIAATKSGGGKTTLTLGIMAALVKRGLSVQPFKCGPDFIDPTLHRSITSIISYNLDPKMMGPDCCRETFLEKSQSGDVSVIEGVMGLFDGGQASTAALSKILKIPVVLIIDAQSSAESSAAVLNGFQSYDKDIEIAGVIFNKIGSQRHQDLIEKAVKDNCRVPIIGFMGRDTAFHIPERHLGLHMGSERPLDDKSILRLIEEVENKLNLDLLPGIAQCKKSEPNSSFTVHLKSKKHVRVGVAMDEAFCFYYPQNFEILESQGIELVPFSPIHDKKLPESLQMLYFGGGYPENYCRELSLNDAMRHGVKSFYDQGLPIYGECGGFMYLCKSITDMKSRSFEMVSIFDFETTMNNRLRRLGYRRVTLQKDCLLGKCGDILHGHEFHYSDINQDVSLENRGSEVTHLYLLDNNSYEGYSVGSAVGSYVHLHFGRTPRAPKWLYNQLI